MLGTECRQIAAATKNNAAAIFDSPLDVPMVMLASQV